MLLTSKLLAALAAFASLARADQVPLSNSCTDQCDALGCNVNNGATPTTQQGTTIIPVVPSGPSPWSPPPGFPGATEAGSSVGPDGKTTVSWKVTQPTDIVVPNSAPTSPPCASWVVTSAVKTIIVGTDTLIFSEPVLTAVGPTPVTSWTTTTTTSTTTSIPPPVTSVSTTTTTEVSISTSTSTSTTTETSITTTTTTSMPPPVTTTSITTTTSTSTSTLTLPPSTTTEVHWSTSTTTSIPPPVTSWSTSTSISTETRWSTTTSIPPPVTSWSTTTSISTQTEWSTTTSIPPPVTSWSTTTSISTQTEWSTSTTTYTPPPVTSWSTTTTTSVPPAVTSWSTTTTTSVPPAITSWSTTTSVSTTTSTTTSVSTSVSTTTSTSTTSVSYCPPGPTTPPVPSTPCVPGIVTAWKNVDIYKSSPFTFTWSDPWPGVLKVQDAGYKTEQYSVAVDNGAVGTTSNVGVDAGAWCGISGASALYTCQAQGMSYGEFALPAGSHSVSVTNLPGIYNDAGNLYSTIYYQVERTCPNTYVPPKPACSADLQTAWTNVDVYEGRNYNLPQFNYNYPVKLTVVDAGYKAEKYYVILDGVQIGLTHDYTTNLGLWCGITADAAQNCLNQGMSSGVFVIPSGSHTVGFSSLSTRNPAWAAYSTVFYKVEKWCP